MDKILSNGKCNQNCYEVYASFYNIFVSLADVIEVTIFAYVVYSQISFTGKQKGRRDALKNILLCGYASVEDIERAVLEQNADLPKAELEDICEQLARFKSFYNETSSSQSIIANLVEYRPGFEFNDYNFKLRRTDLEADDEPREEEYQESCS